MSRRRGGQDSVLGRGERQDGGGEAGIEKPTMDESKKQGIGGGGGSCVGRCQ